MWYRETQSAPIALAIDRGALVEPAYCLIPVPLEVSQYRNRARVDSEYGVYCTGYSGQ